MSANRNPIDPNSANPQAFNEEDRRYRGSTFKEVNDALFANPYYSVWGGENEPPLPVYDVSLPRLLSGVLSFGKRFKFLQAARRTVDSNADLRWGTDGKGWRRLLHPNGICLSGRWEMTADSDYTGYFQQGSEGLVVARYSTCCTETRRGHSRSLSLVGKLYPTTDPNHVDPLMPASFITQQDIGGDYTDYINDVELRNTPDTTAWRRGMGVPALLLTGLVFMVADRQPAQRQTYEIAELGKSDDQPTHCPEFLRFIVSDQQARISGEHLDFRDEILAQIYDRGDSQAKRQLIFNIEVSDHGNVKGPAAYQRVNITHWRRIGRLIFDQAVASYNGDFVIHFHHPTWRHQRNDANTAVRVNNQKVG